MKEKEKLSRENLFFGISTLLQTVEGKEFEMVKKPNLIYDDEDLEIDNQWIINKFLEYQIICKEEVVLKDNRLFESTHGNDSKTKSIETGLNENLYKPQICDILIQIQPLYPYVLTFVETLLRKTKVLDRDLTKMEIVDNVKEFINCYINNNENVKKADELTLSLKK